LTATEKTGEREARSSPESLASEDRAAADGIACESGTNSSSTLVFN
jgi:hypothetical protein